MCQEEVTEIIFPNAVATLLTKLNFPASGAGSEFYFSMLM